MGAHRRASAFGVLLTALVAVLAGVGAFLITHAGLHVGRSHPSATMSSSSPLASPAPTPPALASATRAPVMGPALVAQPPEPSVAAVTAALAGSLADPALGPSVRLQVSDAISGDVLAQRDGGVQAAPASTAKLATAVAVLAAHPSTDRITTTVVAGISAGQIVLVGAGDPTLSGAAVGSATTYPAAARLSDLASQLRAAGIVATQIVVDDSLFTGPAVSPAWLPGDVPSNFESAITAVLADGGRDAPGAATRSSAPDLGAGRELAALLGVPPSQVVRGVAPAGASQLANVQSATYGDLVEQMLQQSDNVIAECLARQVALAQHQPASFAGAAAAVRSVLAGLGVDIGAAMADGSGLSPSDRLSPAALVALLRLALVDARPGLREVIDDLPVAGWDGTLANRYTNPPSQVGAGVVRAKTGTLTSVSALAGVVTTSSGRVLVFAFIADQVARSVAATAAAEAALDKLASALAA